MHILCAALRAGHGCHEFPVNVRGIARGLRVRVIEAAWQGRPHAVCFWPQRIILLNAARSETSRRFDLAHELGHYVFAPQRYHGQTENRFAAELLMPARVFRLEAIVSGIDPSLADYFGVSEAVIRMRANELGIR